MNTENQNRNKYKKIKSNVLKVAFLKKKVTNY